MQPFPAAGMYGFDPIPTFAHFPIPMHPIAAIIFDFYFFSIQGFAIVMTAENYRKKTEEELDREAEKSEEKTEKLVKKLKKSEKIVKHYQWFILRLLVFLLVIWILFFQVIGLTRMPSGDMYPRIDSGDMVLFYRLDKDVKAQDIDVGEVTQDVDDLGVFGCQRAEDDVDVVGG